LTGKTKFLLLRKRRHTGLPNRPIEHLHQRIIPSVRQPAISCPSLYLGFNHVGKRPLSGQQRWPDCVDNACGIVHRSMVAPKQVTKEMRFLELRDCATGRLPVDDNGRNFRSTAPFCLDHHDQISDSCKIAGVVVGPTAFTPDGAFFAQYSNKRFPNR
jgi:hypothetical protein